MVLEIAKKARAASLKLANATTEQKNRALAAIAQNLRKNAESVLAKNAVDLEKARAAGISKAMLERLALSPEKIEAVAKGVEAVIALEDPVGVVLENRDRPNGLNIRKLARQLALLQLSTKAARM